MKKENNRSTALSKTVKSILLALGIGLTVNSCSSCSDIKNDTRIENDGKEDDYNLETPVPTESIENIETPCPTDPIENIETPCPTDPVENIETPESTILPENTENPETNNENNATGNSNDDKEHEHDNHNHNYGNWQYYNDNQEISTCEDCGKIKYRKHNLENNQINYISNNDGTHKIIQSQNCTSCDYSTENSYDTKCNLGTWTYNPTTGLEERNCNECGYKETRTHQHQNSTNLVYKLSQTNGNGTHKLNATYNCSICGEEIKLYKDVQCNLGTWTYNPTTGLEERNCNVCGYKETRIHEHQKPSNLEYDFDRTNGDGTHKLKTTYTCTICNQQITLYKDESCDYPSWSAIDEVSCIRECTICGYDDVQKHNYIVVPNSVTSNATIGLHNVLERCNDCGKEKTVAVSCTGDGNKYFYEDGNIISERENCAICHDVCIQDPHNHIYGNYTSADDNNHEKTCACGDKSSEAHSYGEWSLNSEGINTRTCSSCGHVQTVICAHDNVQRIETTVGTADCCHEIIERCNDCGYENRITTSHNFQEDIDDFYVIYTCYNCTYRYTEETLPLLSLNSDIYMKNNEENNEKKLVLK